jgi:cell division protein FtsB
MPPKKRNFKKRFQTWHILLLLIFAFIVYSFGSEYLKLDKLNQKYMALQVEKQSLLLQEKMLLSQHKYMESPAFIELTARKELGFIKPGEYLVVAAKPGNVKILKKKPSLEEIKD